MCSSSLGWGAGTVRTYIGYRKANHIRFNEIK